MTLLFLRLFSQFRELEAANRELRVRLEEKLGTRPAVVKPRRWDESEFWQALGNALDSPNPVMPPEWDPVAHTPPPAIKNFGYFQGKNGLEFRQAK